MSFKIGDKVKYVGPNKKYWGHSGTIIKVYSIIGPLCYIVKMFDGVEEHQITRYLELNQKNQQLLFDFMD